MDMMLANLINAFRVSGHESNMREILRSELRDVDCAIKEDDMGNLIVKVGQGSEKVMFSANMDQSGIMVTYIEDNGYVRIIPVGEMTAQTVLNKLVVFENGAVGKVASAKESPSYDDLFVDLGLDSKEEVIKKIKEGDVACILESGFEVEGKLVSPGLNNRIGCYVMLRLIKDLGNVENLNKECYFVFSAQGELEGRGGRAAAYNINPNYCIVLNIQETGDYIGAKGNVKLGKGPVIRLKDKSMIMSSEVKEILEKAAEKAEVGVQYGVATEGTEGGLIHRERGGIKTGVLAVPIRYNHTMTEMISLKDVEDTVKLLGEVLK